MAFCRNCGQKLDQGAAFCSGCGQAAAGPGESVESAKQSAGGYQLPEDYQPTADGHPVTGPVTTGYSDRIRLPEVQQFKKKMKKAGLIFMAALALIALIIVFITAGEDLGSALLIWAFVVALTTVLGFFSSRKGQKTWDGTLEEKRIVYERHHGQDNHYQDRQVPTLFFKTTSGKKEKVPFNMQNDAYHHYQVGDHVRKHPGFMYPEKYAKSDTIICLNCGRLLDRQLERCTRCKLITIR